MTIKSLFGPNTKTPKSIRIKVIKPVFQTVKIRENLPDYLTNNQALSSSRVVYDLFQFLANESKEHFISVHLDSKNKILCVELVSTGSLNASVVHPREVFKSCLLSSCAAILVLHNHPSGDPEPSREDLEITTRLKSAAELLGIRMLDHVIVGNGRYVSFADRGII